MSSKVKFFIAPVLIGALLGGLAYNSWKSMTPPTEEGGTLNLFEQKETIYVWYDADQIHILSGNWLHISNTPLSLKPLFTWNRLISFHPL